MKNIFIIAIVVIAAFTSCEKDDDLVMHNIMIRGQQNLKSTALLQDNPEHLTPKEVVRQAWGMQGKPLSEEILEVYGYPSMGDVPWWYGEFPPVLRDTVNDILKRFSSDILYKDKIVPDFILSKDIIFFRLGDNSDLVNIDTIAYIPNALINDARELIFDAYAEERWQDIYDIFNENFNFIPITGSEYKELERQGVN